MERLNYGALQIAYSTFGYVQGNEYTSIICQSPSPTGSDAFLNTKIKIYEARIVNLTVNAVGVGLLVSRDYNFSFQPRLNGRPVGVSPFFAPVTLSTPTVFMDSKQPKINLGGIVCDNLQWGASAFIAVDTVIDGAVNTMSVVAFIIGLLYENVPEGMFTDQAQDGKC